MQYTSFDAHKHLHARTNISPLELSADLAFFKLTTATSIVCRRKSVAG